EQLTPLLCQPCCRIVLARAMEPEPDQPIEDRPDPSAPIGIVAERRIGARHRRQAETTAKGLLVIEMNEEMAALRIIGGTAEQRIEAGRRKTPDERSRPQTVGEDHAPVIPEMTGDGAPERRGAVMIFPRLVETEHIGDPPQHLAVEAGEAVEPD